MESLVDLSLYENVEFEKCVVPQFRTTVEQKKIFEEHLLICDINEIPIEWVIDIADETCGWFYGTAYHYNDSTRMLHVKVPDKENPTFDGLVALDYRTVHLIECVDKKSDALFNKIIRDSIIKIKWNVEWLDDNNSEPALLLPSGSTDETYGSKWVISTARYCIRMANQLLIEDATPQNDDKSGVPSYVMVALDLNVKLLECYKGRGIEDFQRLITDKTTLFTPEAENYAQNFISTQKLSRQDSIQSSFDTTETGAVMANRLASVRKLADLAHTLKDSVEDLLDEGKKISVAQIDHARAFQNFTMNGDLDAGLQLMNDMNLLLQSADGPTDGDSTVTPSGTTMIKSPNQRGNDPISAYTALAEETTTLTYKLERGMNKLIKSTETQEFEMMRRDQIQLRLQLESKEKEIKRLRAAKK